MSQTGQKGSFIQTMLFAMVIFLLMQMLCNKPSQTASAESTKFATLLQTGKPEAFQKELLAQKGSPTLGDDVLRAIETTDSKGILIVLSVLDGQMDDPAIRPIGAARAVQIHSALQNKIKQEKEAKKLTTEAANLQDLNGLVLVSDLQYKAGVLSIDSGPLTQAFYMLHGQDQAFGKDVWATTQFQLTPSPKFPESTTTADGLHTRLVGELRTQFESHMTWGLLPGFKIIDGMVRITGALPDLSYAFAALLLALLVRAVVWPLTQKQYKFGRQMSQLQPLIKELREKYKDKKTGQATDMAEMNRKMMELYKDYGVNPMAGCLPVLIQMPFFFFIYACMQQYRFEFTKGHFLWINPSFSEATNGFIAPNLGEKDYILIGIYAVSMVITTLLTPVSDPSNARQQRIMGVSMAGLFSIMMFFYPLPSAFVLYWVFLNVFATAQMLYIYRQPVTPLVKKNAPGGGVFPVQNLTTTNGQPKATGKPVKHKPKKKR